MAEKALFAFTDSSVLAEELSAGARQCEKRSRLPFQSEKKSIRKAGFAFLGDFVLTEELGDGAGQHEKRNQPVSSDRQKRNRPERPGLPFWAILF
ncbi:hypothetical protein [Metabacillus indicus]|uniref:hypothetical protein n=1 Tax=Metabacillus indicus TaxID=246786 RepID=UPI0004930ED0|nr:hypothetical protein [Metabacillus indicus]KEZ50469.1 hypothetical protein AZ46_0207265 [Metabacillus indicus LMG 22858]